jgi:putative hydrolase of the HAD superfamily
VAVLLLDLDNTLVDREGAFLAWARRKAAEWAPSDPCAVPFLVEQDDDGLRSRRTFLSAANRRFGLRASVEDLVADYRRELLEALPRTPGDVVERLGAMRADG